MSMTMPTSSRDESMPIASTSFLQCPNYSHSRFPTDGSSAAVKVEDRSPLLTVSHSFDSLCLSPADSAHRDQYVNNSLISPPSPSRHTRSSALHSASAPLNSFQSPTLLPTFRNPSINNSRKDVLPSSVNASVTSDLSDTNQHGLLSPAYLLASTSSHHVSINPYSNRPRTSHPVFTSTSDLAAHHGIPQSLPPVPRTTRYQEPQASTSTFSAPNTDFEFTSLCSSYLNMLSQKPQEPVIPESTHSMPTDEHAAAVQALMDVIQGNYGFLRRGRVQLTRYDSYDIASPQFQTGSDFDDFLTSPMEESPWEEFLTTPALGADDGASEFLTSPAIADTDDFGAIHGLPLFPGEPPAVDPLKAAAPVTASLIPPFPFDEMYPMPSPNTPSLDPSSLHPSPLVQTTSPASDSRRKNAPTGTRKGVTPESLVPFDAPIQTRNYITPSATSRKEVPAVFQRKRSRTVAFGKDDEDQLAEDGGVPPSQTEMDAIEAKRRQNTLAARRSRKRKLEYQRELEEGIEREREEKEHLHSRCLMLEAYIKSHGLPVP